MNESLPTVTQEIVGINTDATTVITIHPGEIIDLNTLLYGNIDSDKFSKGEITIDGVDYKIIEPNAYINADSVLVAFNFFRSIIAPVYINNRNQLVCRKNARRMLYQYYSSQSPYAIGSYNCIKRLQTNQSYYLLQMSVFNNPSNTEKVSYGTGNTLESIERKAYNLSIKIVV